jgi:hypothetical protein
MNIWQRGTSFTIAAGGVYCADRFEYNAAATPTVSQESFAIGDIAGYNPTYYLRFVKGNTTADALSILQKIEDVRTFAGQTVTLSFWAKGSAAFTNEPLTRQVFGSGGSGDVYTGFTTQSITTSWARYSMTFTMPSISGKTIGAGSFTAIYAIRYLGTPNITVDTWGWQLELGSVATAFQTATGTIQGELAACQRYYWRNTPGTNYGTYGVGVAGSTTVAYIPIFLPVPMRITPTSIDVPTSASNLQLTNWGTTSWTPSAISIDASGSTFNTITVQATTTGLVTGQAVTIRNNNGSSSSYFIGASAEL